MLTVTIVVDIPNISRRLSAPDHFAQPCQNRVFLARNGLGSPGRWYVEHHLKTRQISIPAGILRRYDANAFFNSSQ
jgi:hypothetical protein